MFTTTHDIDLILPAYNEESSIRKCIEDFESLNLFKEIIAIDNNSTDNTAAEVKKTIKHPIAMKSLRTIHGSNLSRPSPQEYLKFMVFDNLL